MAKTWFRDKQSGNPICYIGDYKDCWRPHFALSRDQSEDVRRATVKINDVFAGLTDGHPELVILDAGGVLILIDAVHDDHAQPDDSDVTGQSDPEVIWEAFGIDPEEAREHNEHLGGARA